MKKFVISCIGFVVIFTVIMIHSFAMARMGKEIAKLSDKAESLAMEEKWEEVSSYMEKIEDYWKGRSIWTALTIKTDELEQIDISLQQSKKYAKLRDKGKFLGEFTMFSKLVEHIPHQEGFHIEEIL